MKTASIAEVQAWLEEFNKDSGVVLVAEQERNWLWLVNDLAPLHKKCSCADCATLAAIRKAIGKEGCGFIYAAAGHVLPSGTVSHWAHHCQHPIRFKRKGKSGSPDEPNDHKPSESFSDDQLAALLA